VVVSLARPVSRLPTPVAASRENGWSYAELTGRLVQLEGAGDSAALTLAFTIILEAQQCGEPAAWITTLPVAIGASNVGAAATSSVFYPPDALETGVDLGALPVVRVPGTPAMLTAADVLLRSGGFGLIVADLGDPRNVEATSLARLAGLARRHHTALIFVTRSDGRRMPAPEDWRTETNIRGSRGSLGSLISLHVQAQRRRAGPDQFRCELTVLKDKQRGPVWDYIEWCRGAVGLR
jgi:recombination protein RecA